jgi:hypothetical protein
MSLLSEKNDSGSTKLGESVYIFKNGWYSTRTKFCTDILRYIHRKILFSVKTIAMFTYYFHNLIACQKSFSQRSRFVFDISHSTCTITTLPITYRIESFDSHYEIKNLVHVLPVIVDIFWPAQKYMTETDEYVCLLTYTLSWISLIRIQ